MNPLNPWIALCLREMRNDTHYRLHFPTKDPEAVFSRTVEDNSPFLGWLVQWCMENPEEFHRFIRPLHNDSINPFSYLGFSFLDNLDRNGIHDDWEIFLHWEETGYSLVSYPHQQPQDARFSGITAQSFLQRQVNPNNQPNGEIVLQFQCALYS